MCGMTYYVVFAQDDNNPVCVVVSALDIVEACDQVREAYGGYVSCLVFEEPPLNDCHLYSLEELEADYGYDIDGY
jgi:hypothetical protein